MCVIAIAEDNRIAPDDVGRMFETNDSGAGIAWRQKGEIIWRKGLNLQEIKDLAASLPLPYVAHFRIPTCGGPYSGLCHPFPINEEVSLALNGRTRGEVLFHNGHWAKWQESLLEAGIRNGKKIPMGRWSDSRALAFFAHHCTLGIIEVIDEKVCAFGPNSLQIFGSTWFRTDGILVSNKLYQAKTWLGGAGAGYRYNKDSKKSEWHDVNGVVIPHSLMGHHGPKEPTQLTAGITSTETPGGASHPTTFCRGPEDAGGWDADEISVQAVSQGVGSETGKVAKAGGEDEKRRADISALVRMPGWVDPELDAEIQKLIATGELDLARREGVGRHELDLPLSGGPVPLVTIAQGGIRGWVDSLNPKRYRIGGQTIKDGVIVTPVRSIMPEEDRAEASAQSFRLHGQSLTHIYAGNNEDDATDGPLGINSDHTKVVIIH